MLGGLFKKEKGQISIEVLIIMAILTIGALVAGTYYISTVNSNIRKAEFADFDGSRAFGIKTPQSVSCGDGTCNGSENCVSCPVDCGTCPPTGCTVGQLTAVNFSPPGGTYTETKNVSLSYTGSCPDVNIFYTWDGTTPTSSSTLYQNLITISNTITIKAKIFANNNSISGPETTQTYTISAIALCPAGGGNGTLANPKIICTPDDLNAIRNNLDWHYILGQDIDLNVSPYNVISFPYETGWEPIGRNTSSIRFSGTLNGNGYSIYNLLIYSDIIQNYPVGLFSEIKPHNLISGPVIKDLNLVDVNIYSQSSESVGGLVGQINNLYNNEKYIENVRVSGTVKGRHNTGGIVGKISCNQNFDSNFYLKNTSFDGYVSGLQVVGGLVAYSNVGLQNGKFSGTVIGSEKVGGLIGELNTVNGIVSSSYSTGTINGTYYIPNGDMYLGGLIGAVINGTINQSYSLATVNSKGTVLKVGGLVGYLDSGGKINNSYYDGDVYGHYYVGGLVAENKGEIKNSHSHGFVSGTQVNPSYFAADIMGGFVGINNNGVLINNYSTADVNGQTMVGGMIGTNRCNSVVDKCYSLGDVIGKESGVGGFIGYTGVAFGETCGNGVTNSYSMGTVTRKTDSSDQTFGGFIGYFGDYSGIIIKNSYSTGKVIYESGITPTNKGFSGMAFFGSNNFWDVDTSQQTTSPAGAIGKTTSQMKIQNTFSDWNFTNIWAINPIINNGYPYLQENPPQ